tara:strand:+ start:89 stop:610 length:522 start_codon:yes stop_codon:yes gene_type:complete
MNRISKAFWVWCDFIEEDMKFLKQIQSKVFDYFDSPLFDIHMTLHGPFINKHELDRKNIHEICQRTNQISIEAKNYKFSDNFYTSLYIEISKSEKLIDLRNIIYNKLPIRNNLYKFLPHISLIYGKYNKSEKLKIIKNLPKITKKVFTVKNIIIADVDENINKWKIIERIGLK